MYVIWDYERDCIVGLPVKNREEAKARARACAKAGRKVVLKKIS